MPENLSDLKKDIKYLMAFSYLGMILFSSQAEAFLVTVLMTDEGSAYQEFAQAFLSESEHQSKSINIVQTTSLTTNTDLVIAVGIKSAQLASQSHFPVLCVLVSKASFEKLLRELPNDREKNTISAIYLDQPIKRQVALVVAVFPEVRRIGLLYSTSTDVAIYRKAIVEKKLELIEHKLGTTESLYHDLEAVLEKSDVLLSLPDAEVYNSLTMRNILLATYRSKIPVAGFSPGYVKAGALCAVFSTSGQIAIQALQLTSQFVVTQRLPVPQYPTEFDVMINQQVARSLGIQTRENKSIIEDIKSSAISKEGAE